MKRLACIILIVTVLVSGLFFVRSAHGITVGGPGLSGTLAADTHWTLSDSPVTFNGTVSVGSVGNAASLTIDPGVTVNMGMYGLYVYGTLIAIGDASNQIVFTASNVYNYTGTISASIIFMSSSTPWSDATSSGSIIQNANLNQIVFQINNASPKIDNCQLNFQTASSYFSPIVVSGGSPTLSSNTISLNVHGSGGNVNSINIYSGTPLITGNHFEGAYSSVNSNDINVNSGSPTITSNTFEGTYTSATNNGITVNSGAPTIANNQFQGDGYLNAIVALSSNSFTISNNVFTNCLVGVKAGSVSLLTIDGNSFLKGTDGIDMDPDASLTITHNLIDGNSAYGINGGGYINSNTITNNRIGIHNPSAGPISSNNIVGNTENSITATTTNVDAENNWWGIADAQTINSTIYDAKIDNRLGNINFVPFLTQPSQTAPVIPYTTPVITPEPTPQPTPEPTDSSVFATPEPTPNQYSQSFIYQVGTIVNLDFITTAIVIVLIAVWIVVILGYVTKKAVFKPDSKRENQT